MEEILVAKRLGEKMKFKVVNRMKKGYSPEKYVKVVNIKDFNDLALLLGDLDILVNAPVEKAYKKYREDKYGNQFPF